MLVECIPCTFYFCSNCLQDFHGFTDCETKPETTLPRREKEASCTDRLKEAWNKFGPKFQPAFNWEESTREESVSHHRNSYQDRTHYNTGRNDSGATSRNSYSHPPRPDLHNPQSGKDKALFREKVKQGGADAEQYELGEKKYMSIYVIISRKCLHSYYFS